MTPAEQQAALRQELYGLFFGGPPGPLPPGTFKAVRAVLKRASRGPERTQLETFVNQCVRLRRQAGAPGLR